MDATPGRAPTFWATPAVVARPFATCIEELETVLPALDSTALVPGRLLTALAVLRLEGLAEAVPPARLAVMGARADAVLETGRTLRVAEISRF